mgnify:FL=1
MNINSFCSTVLFMKEVMSKYEKEGSRYGFIIGDSLEKDIIKSLDGKDIRYMNLDRIKNTFGVFSSVKDNKKDRYEYVINADNVDYSIQYLFSLLSVDVYVTGNTSSSSGLAMATSKEDEIIIPFINNYDPSKKETYRHELENIINMQIKVNGESDGK